MNLTRNAITSSRLTFAIALMMLLGGILSFLNFPSQEEPSITVRDAMVMAAMDGLSTEQTERLLAQPLENKLRELPEIKTIQTTVRPGKVYTQITAYDTVKNLPAVWQRARNKINEASANFPAGAEHAQIDDDFGSVAVATIAVTAPGFTTWEMRRPVEELSNQLRDLNGVDRVSLIGLPSEQLYVELDSERLSRSGLSPSQIGEQLRKRNAVLGGGTPVVGGQNISIQITGNLRNAEDVSQFQIALPEGGSLPLGSLAKVHSEPKTPPDNAAIYQGQDAVVIAVSMTSGQSIEAFGAALRERLATLEKELPAGFNLHEVTFQADVVHHAMDRMHHVLLETILSVMAVVVLFLGWRTGMVVGAIVPLTIFATLIAMRFLGIQLQTVSIAAIILALGLLVDNGIVIAEDIERRLHAGEDRRRACEEAGRTLALPLLTSSLVIVLAFSPFFLGKTSTNEYLQSLAVVLALNLLGSWVLSLTVTPLLCYFFAKEPAQTEAQGAETETRFYRTYRSLISSLLDHKVTFIASMLVLLGVAVVTIMNVPYDFLPKSDRKQFQIPMSLEPGTDSRKTLQRVRDISNWLEQHPHITQSIGYVADGGPRIVLGLNPPQPGPEVAYFTVSVDAEADIDQIIAEVGSHLSTHYPDMQAQPQRFSLGSTETGVATYRISGPDTGELRKIADQIADTLRSLPGTVNVKDNWGPSISRLVVKVNQQKAELNGINREDIARALQLRNGGMQASIVYDGSTPIPVVIKDATKGATSMSLEGTWVYPETGAKPVQLSSIAQIDVAFEPALMMRRDKVRSITVTGSNPALTATSIVEQLAPQIEALQLPTGYRIELGGEIEDAADTNDALLMYMPHAFVAMLLLFIWQFNSMRKLAIILLSVPFALIGVSLALVLTGYPFSFMATFGVLSLAGIIVNNAVLLLERIEVERQNGHSIKVATVNAAVKRLRPIVMTKLTCITGLVPLLLFGGSLWEGMAISMIGGLALGTLITLGLIPLLYDLLFSTLPEWFGRRRRTA
ncbi:efflux RND transporter permease subunit [Pseudomonas vanderleydeniana]|uniref:Efflux RND transporter permease subunit n=1 Tax=Pseudomonas vanderleydeniana TaxID=2745495 RepID=A0A9E6TUJ4_9PSED|nr:efflux RND transporter permease subunit [Pseudomonas vanderleydeniana]QXI30899.1 efflux RND transporter permease subunit [Pseudomonas vanderleydeniana]